MKIIEPLILLCWLMGIFIYQFHDASNKKIKKHDPLNLFPSFHLFSPKPFLGLYIIRYKVINSSNIKQPTRVGEITYIRGKDFFHANKKIIKCINNLCKRFPVTLPNNNFRLLLHYVRHELISQSTKGKFQFSIFLRHGNTETLKFTSKFYDI